MASDREAYDLTHDIFDRLEDRGMEVTEAVATLARAVAHQVADLLEAFRAADDQD